MEILKPRCLFKQIVRTANRLEMQANRCLFNNLDLTLSSLTILYLIYKNKSITPSLLMKELFCSKSNITQRLNVMEKSGLIVRKTAVSAKDKRRVGIEITEGGKARLAQAIKVVRRKGLELEEALGKEEVERTFDFLDSVNAIIDNYECNNTK